MRKATGKVVSLVLALALVVTSFSSTFAFAATKTESGEVYSGIVDDVTLVNLSNVADSAKELQDARNVNNQDKFNITNYVNANNVVLETKDHIEVENVEISSVSVRGDNIVRVSKVTATQVADGGIYNGVSIDGEAVEEGDYIATVRSATGTGTATVSVLFTGTATRGDTEITVRATETFTITLKDAKTPYFDTVESLPKNPESVKGDWVTTYADNYKDSGNKEPVVTATAELVLPVIRNHSAQLETTKAQPVYADDGRNDDNWDSKFDKDGEALPDDYWNSEKEYATKGSIEENGYLISASGTNNYLSINDSTITYGVVDPTVGNTVRLSAYSLREVKEGNVVEGYTTNRVIDQASVRVENRLEGSIANIGVGSGDRATVGLNGNQTIMSKSRAYTQIDGRWWDATGSNIDTDVALNISEVRVGNVSADDSVNMADATVGSVSAGGNVDVSGGTVGAIDANTDANTHDVTISGGTVASVTDANTVTINEGTVSGNVSANEVMLNPSNEEVTATVSGTVTAETLTVDGSIADASVGGYFAQHDHDANWNVTLIGANASIGAIDADYDKLVVTMQNFQGTIPAIANGQYYENNDNTGATLNTADIDSMDPTNATVNANLNIRTLELNSGVVEFAGSVNVSELYGSEATIVAAPGAIRVTEGIASSNTLKLNTANITPGMIVYYAAPEIADEESLVGVGYTMNLTTGTSWDTFTVDEVSFAGLQFVSNGTPVDNLNVVVGDTVTVNAVAYPNGTTLPEGMKITFYSDADEDYIYAENAGDGVATIQAKNYSDDFTVLNQGTITAVVTDEFDMIMEEYGEATLKVNVVPQPSIVSDTTHDFTLPQGSTYQFKLTVSNGATPVFKSGNTTALPVVAQSNSGNDYFYTVRADGQVGEQIGIYADGAQGVNENNRLLVITIGQGTGTTAAYTCDTTAVNVPAGASYQVKITSATRPTLAAGNSSYTVEFVQQSGNNYYFRITAATAQAGDQVGFYINGGARAFIATTV